jgi:Carboxypeptidase regulatory-like domain
MRILAMRQMIAAVTVATMVLATLPLSAAGAPRPGQAQTASLSGTASSSTGQTLVNTTVRLRNLATGQVSGTTTSSATGSFSFAGLQAGQYSVEVLNAAGQIVGTSSAISVTAGAVVTGVGVTASAAAAGGAAAGAAGAAGAAVGTGIGTTAIVITSAAVAAGVLGAVAIANNNASPSR